MNFEEATKTIDSLAYSPSEFCDATTTPDEAEGKGWSFLHLPRLFPLRKAKATKKPLPKLIELGLYHSVVYGFQARAAWEVLALADELGEKLEDEYGLYPNGQGKSGIGLDWHKLSERIWVPADYLNEYGAVKKL